MSAPVGNQYLEGNFAPVPDEATALDLEVTGSLPPQLDGRYLRIGPNPLHADPATYHWFTGAGMVHGVRLRDGRAEWYRNRFVRVGDVARDLGDDDPGGPVTEGADFAPNTNVIGVGGRTLALVEAGAKPVELTDELDTVARFDFCGTLPHGYSAHPKVDPDTGELHACGYYWARDGVLEYTVASPDGRVTHRRDIEVPGGPMVHDVSITERHTILYDLPVVFDLESAVSGALFPYAWSDDHPARIGVIDRAVPDSPVRWFEVSPCYVFHALNAHDVDDDRGRRIVLDVVRHDRVFDAQRLSPDESEPTLWRWEVDLDRGTVRESQTSDVAMEFPRVDERRVGRPYRHGWATSAVGGFDGAEIIGVDPHDGTTRRRAMGAGRAAGEVVMVPASDDAAEDDGWLMTFVYDAATDRSELLLLDAADPEGDAVASVHLPRRVPFGFHGNWVPAG